MALTSITIVSSGTIGSRRFITATLVTDNSGAGTWNTGLGQVDAFSVQDGGSVIGSGAITGGSINFTSNLVGSPTTFNTFVAGV